MKNNLVVMLLCMILLIVCANFALDLFKIVFFDKRVDDIEKRIIEISDVLQVSQIEVIEE